MPAESQCPTPAFDATPSSSRQEPAESMELSHLDGSLSSPATTLPIVPQDRHGQDEADLATLRNESHLAPVDGGYQAWSFLAGAFVIETIAWGFPSSYGVFLDAYLADSKWASQSRAGYFLPLIGTLSSGLSQCISCLLYPLSNRFPRLRRPVMWLGALLSWIALFSASYTDDVKQLVGLQGALYAIGGALLYAPVPNLVQEWFVARRGIAYGVIYAGTSFAGLFFPVLLPHLFSLWGIAKTLRYLSIILAACTAAALLMIKPRLPERRVHAARRSRMWRAEEYVWLKDWSWLLFILANTLQGFAYYVPIVWLPTFASALNVSRSTSSLSLFLLNGASVIAKLGFGALSDHVSPWILALVMFSLTSVATFTLWGVVGNIVAGVLVFGGVYGMLAGGWFALWEAFVKGITKDNPSASMTIMGILMLSTGLGNILSTPISTALPGSSSSMVSSDTHSNTLSSHSGFGVEGGKYERMIVYVGSCFAAAALVALLGWGGERTGFLGRRS
ncbi:MFS general substrate transporter [Stereum hirsutum FP-91666 SS1]|uniref:MFS general substrate transporter n=1 Tax=Stereum hirsutum (strain FP-91666) TaxID=721885 RepID=UPI000444A24F|nr:MFS general substrate transporter [Stereum hirsutum FP-91666 SS1]EIM85762.1 MFS general substrate transporter [Stereum hirsutum FP-91666 SS1]